MKTKKRYFKDLNNKRNVFWIIFSRHSGFITNALMFFSAFVLIVDFSPVSLLPFYRSQIHAIDYLKEHKNILKSIPNTNIKGEDASLQFVENQKIVDTLIPVIFSI